MKNLGKVCTLYARLAARESDEHADVDLWHAPGECHGIVADGVCRDTLALAQSIERATGYSAADLEAELAARVSPGWLYRAGWPRLLSDVAEHERASEQARLWRKRNQRAQLPR